MIWPLARRAWCTAVVALLVSVFIQSGEVSAEQVAVRHTEGELHGFLVLRSLSGVALAAGDLIQSAHGDEITSQLVFQFKDGSVHDETVVFSQKGNFRLLKYHLVQKGRSFPHPADLSIDGLTGQVEVHSTDQAGKQTTIKDQLHLPADLANGLVSILLKNFPPQEPQLTLSMLAAAPKPRLVKLNITRQGEETFSVAGSSRKATHYVVKIEIGGVAGLVAPLLGKQPPDVQVWVFGGKAPVFVKSQGQLFFGGPIWRIELVGPVWP